MDHNADIRTYRAADQAAVAALYSQGLLAGENDRNDTGADIDFMEEAYFSDPKDHFWVAERDGQIVGTIGVVHDEAIAQIRRLRVVPELQKSSLAVDLLDTALRHCRKHGFLKIVLDTRIDPQRAIELLDSSGFQFHRGKSVHGKEVLEFYFNLYRKVEPEKEREPARQPANRNEPIPAAAPAPRDEHQPIRVLLADDHDALRMGLIELLSEEADIEVIGEARDGEEAVRMARQTHPDLVVMDVSMPKLNGIEATRQIAAELPHTRVIGLSMHEKHEVATSMLQAGATAYLPKDAPTQLLISAIRGNERPRASATP